MLRDMIHSVVPHYMHRSLRAGARSFAVALGLLAACWSGSARAECAGDCSGDRLVNVSELIRAVNIALGTLPLSDCLAADRDGDGTIAISELIASVNSALQGCPPQETPTSTATATATPTASATATETTTSTPTATPTATVNLPPSIQSLGVYRSFPELEISYQIDAVDPEGGVVAFEPVTLPDGASLSGTGLFSWTPTADQIGAYQVAFESNDTEGAKVEGTLPIRITELDTCTAPDCAPATGCDAAPLPTEQDCCASGPVERVAEPSAECPDGLVLYAGRNDTGFGRMQNCDLLQIEPGGQGGAHVIFHIEARCVNPEGLARVIARMETADVTLFDRTSFFQLDQRDDGFAEARGLLNQLNVPAPASFVGEEAQLSLALIDSDGLRVETSLRVVLTADQLDDLPDLD